MSLSHSRLCRELVAAATAFHARHLWGDYGNNDGFTLIVPDEEHPMFACIMGQGGDEFGLMLFRGPEARECFLAMLDAHPDDREMPDATAFIGFSMTRFAHVPEPARAMLRKAGLVSRRENIVPYFVAKDAGRQPRAITSDETRTCIYALKGILKAHDRGILKPVPLHAGAEVLTLAIMGDVLDPDVTGERRRYENAAPVNIVAFPHVPNDLRTLPRLSARWLIGFPSIPVRIRDDDRTVRVLTIVDEDTELILSGEPLQGGVPDALEAIYKAFRGHGPVKNKGLPRAVLVANRELFLALEPVLRSLEVECSCEPSIPLLDEITAGFLGKLAGDHPEEQPKEGFQAGTPSADDLYGWKGCDKRLYQRAMSHLPDTDYSPDKAVARYFGDVDTGRTFLGDPDDSFPGCCFFEWLWLDYRAGKHSRTLAERMLAGALPEPERTVLRARMDAVPSFYKVQAIQKGESLTLLDVLFGGETVVYDKGLSESAEIDMSFAARVFPVGDFHLVSSLGPPVPVLAVDEAVDFLKAHRLELTPEGTRAKPHLFGHLWAWLEERRREKLTPPRMANTDGESLFFHTATYAVTDENAARKAIAARKDVKPQDGRDGYTWLRHGPSASGMGEALHLGTLSFVGEALLVEVNSAERFAKVRQWLDAVPGIAFRTVRTRSLKETLESGVPLDDRRTPEEKVPMTPELLEHVRSMLNNHYMKWLDTSIPAFDGKTPRQMCQSAEGRERVARMIRTMPKSRGPDGADIDVPRKGMLKALGLGPT